MFTSVKQQDFPRRSFHNAQMKIKRVTVTKFISALLLQGKLHCFKTSNSSAVRRFYRSLIGKPVTLNTFIQTGCASLSFLNICSKYSSMKFRAKRLLETCMCQVFKICNLCNTCFKILNFPAKRLRKNTALKIRMRQFFQYHCIVNKIIFYSSLFSQYNNQTNTQSVFNVLLLFHSLS